MTIGRLAGKVAIITGGARGMGAAHARAFVREGARVAITDRREEHGARLADELGDASVFLRHDVGSEDDWAAVVEATEERFGPVSILVNNAGIAQGPVAIAELSLADWERLLQVNLTGAFLGIRASMPSLRRAGGGSIVNVSSVAGLQGLPNSAGYVASKFGLRGLTKAAALELADDGIRVNAVFPGYVRTPILGPLAEERPAQRDLAIKRFGEPDEVSALVLFLASDEASYSTGSDFVVDGGWTAGGPIG